MKSKIRLFFISFVVLMSYSTIWGQDSACAVPQLAYVAENNVDTAQIRVVDADLQNDRLLVDVQATVRSMDWSPDGTKLAFSAAINPVPQSLFTIDSDGTNQVEVVQAPSISKVSWSPDGEWIGYLSAQALYLIKPDGTSLTEVPVATTADNFVWSPDSKYFAVEARDKNGSGGIYLVDPFNISVKQVSEPDLTYANDAHWIANDLITFSSYDGVYLLDPFAEAPESVLYLPLEGGVQTFWQNHQVSDAIILHDGDAWLFREDELTKLTDDQTDPLRVSWSSDGQYIAYTFRGTDDQGVFTGIYMHHLDSDDVTFIYRVGDMLDWRPC